MITMDAINPQTQAEDVPIDFDVIALGKVTSGVCFFLI